MTHNCFKSNKNLDDLAKATAEWTTQHVVNSAMSGLCPECALKIALVSIFRSLEQAGNLQCFDFLAVTLDTLKQLYPDEITTSVYDLNEQTRH